MICFGNLKKAVLSIVTVTEFDIIICYEYMRLSLTLHGQTMDF